MGAMAAEVVASEPERVTRAPSDVLRLVVATGALVAVAVIGRLFDEAIVKFGADLLRGLDALPSALVTSLVAIGQVLGAVLLATALVAALVRWDSRLLGAVLVGGAAAVLLFALLRPLVDEAAARVTTLDESYTLVQPDRTPSAAGLAAITAVVTVVAPWVPRRWRQAAWAFVLIEAAIHFMGNVVSFDTVLALTSGWVAGAAAVVALGAPSRRPGGAAIAAGLDAVGIPLARLEQASLDARGSTPFFGTRADGSSLFVKALGEDERSADLLFRAYRRLQPRNLGDEKAFSTLRRAVEHEALVALFARSAAVRTPPLVALATAEPNGYVLAYEAIAGRSLDRLDPGDVTDAVLGAVWDQLALLRSRRIAHRDLRLANVFLADDGEVWLIDFGFSEMAASDVLLKTDLAEMLASSTTKVGADRAVAAGQAAVGCAVLATALERLRLPMLSGATRAAMKSAPGLLEELRMAIRPT
jgi:glycosyltransferase 2 family protein